MNANKKKKIIYFVNKCASIINNSYLVNNIRSYKKKKA